MKAVINPTLLSKELKKLSLVIKKNTVIPILSTVKFSFEKNKLTLTATDLETTCISEIECECAKPFDVCIEYTDILEVSGSVLNPLELSVDENGINIKSGKAKYKFSISATPDQFPLIPVDSFDFSIQVAGDFFFNLSKANTVKSKDMGNFNMAAIDITKSSVTVVGTDAVSMFTWVTPTKSKKELVIMVADTFVQLCKLFQETTISIGEKFIKAVFGNDTVISRLSENTFVPYKNIISPDIFFNLVISKSDLKTALNQISVACNFKSKQSVLTFSEGKIKLRTQDVDFGKEAETEIEVEHKVELEAICFNTVILLHLLSLITTDNIEMAVTHHNKAAYIRPQDDENTLCLLMPLQLT